MRFLSRRSIIYLAIILAAACTVFFVEPKFFAVKYDSAISASVPAATPQTVNLPPQPPAVLDVVAYNKKLAELANYPIVPPVPVATSTSTAASSAKKPLPAKVTPPPLWPVKTVYPNAGALLPFNRIVAYYGNFYSKNMGVLGQYPPTEMLARLNAEVQKWQLADPTTPVIPAIDYIAVTAQGNPQPDGTYRLRMPDSQIQEAIKLADQIHGIVVLDVQVGLSTVQKEIPLLDQYLKMPEVNLALDPEFSMKTGAKPGTVIGTMDATDINYAANHLAAIVKANNLPPKILVIHRFTQDMVTHYKLITPLPEVQIVMDMDGWGSPAKKLGTYQSTIYKEPVQFTGFKLFYKNDLLPPSTRMLTPADLLKLIPQPSFIQYQ